MIAYDRFHIQNNLNERLKFLVNDEIYLIKFSFHAYLGMTIDFSNNLQFKKYNDFVTFEFT